VVEENPPTSPAPAARPRWLLPALGGAAAVIGAVVLVVVLTGGSPGVPYRVPSPAMTPTLRVGQIVHVAVDSSYVPKVGEIVVFHPPAGAEAATPTCGNGNQGAGHSQACSTPTAQESDQSFIKRVVAGPGDKLAIRNGKVVLNGEPQPEPYVAPCGTDASLCNFPTPITIPPGDYFLLGDNRGESDDSRFWGPVPKAWIIGKVTT
jgi:signal peptidase I